MKERPPYPNKALVDFDDTLSKTVWDGEEWKMGSALPGMVEAVRNCARTHEIVIFTSRPFSDWEKLRDWLKVHQIPYNGILSKPLADIYVDDRSMKPDEFRDRFNPNYERTRKPNG